MTSIIPSLPRTSSTTLCLPQETLDGLMMQWKSPWLLHQLQWPRESLVMKDVQVPAEAEAAAAAAAAAERANSVATA